MLTPRARILSLAFFLLAIPVRGWSQTQYDTSPGAQTGVQVYGSYFNGDVDTIGLYNGNLMLNVGLFNLLGRELSMGLSLSYNSQEWEQKSCSDGSGGSFTCGQYSGGWRIANPFGSNLSIFLNWEVITGTERSVGGSGR